MKNLKKIIAAILITTLTLGCVSSIGTLGSEPDTEDCFFGDGTETFNPGRHYTFRENKLMNLRSTPLRVNVLDGRYEEEDFKYKKMCLILSFQCFLNYLQQVGVLTDSSPDIELDSLKIAAREILKKCIFAKETPVVAPCLTNTFLNELEKKFDEDSCKIIFCKIICDFIRSEIIKDKDKEEAKKSCDLLRDEGALAEIIQYIDSLEERKTIW